MREWNTAEEVLKEILDFRSFIIRREGGRNMAVYLGEQEIQLLKDHSREVFEFDIELDKCTVFGMEIFEVKTNEPHIRVFRR